MWFIRRLPQFWRDENGSIRIEHDRHINGIFLRETWQRLLQRAGFTGHIVSNHYKRELFVALKQG